MLKSAIDQMLCLADNLFLLSVKKSFVPLTQMTMLGTPKSDSYFIDGDSDEFSENIIYLEYAGQIPTECC
ncbi:hypothetical protein FACS1894127_4260 [Clostridia bacterium]|nr:hypothetical protein FACS1894127_4260 [Clostridia bacterium]